MIVSEERARSSEASATYARFAKPRDTLPRPTKERSSIEIELAAFTVHGD